MFEIAIIGALAFYGYIAWHWCIQYTRKVSSYERYVDAFVDATYEDNDDDDDFDFDFRSL